MCCMSCLSCCMLHPPCSALQLVAASGGNVYLHKNWHDSFPADLNTALLRRNHAHARSSCHVVSLSSQRCDGMHVMNGMCHVGRWHNSNMSSRHVCTCSPLPDTGFRGSLQVRMSSSLAITRVIGAVTELPENDKQPRSPGQLACHVMSYWSIMSQSGMSWFMCLCMCMYMRCACSCSCTCLLSRLLDVTTLSFDLCSCRPDSTLTLYYNLEEDIPRDYIYFQFIIRYVDVTTRTYVTRVSTRRVRTTGNVQTYARAIDWKVRACTSMLMHRTRVVDYCMVDRTWHAY